MGKSGKEKQIFYFNVVISKMGLFATGVWSIDFSDKANIFYVAF
jgi:hypothetical protein